jgi:hypothetical protein
MSFNFDDPQHEIDIRLLLANQVRLMEQIVLNTDPSGALPVRLMGNATQQVKVNEAGELLISDGPYDFTEFRELDVINTAYNFYGPLGREQFVITGFFAYADKQVSNTTNATVIIYESSSKDSITVDKVLFQFEIGQNQAAPFPNIRVLCNKGVYVNAQTDDDDVHLTILGHYVDLNGNGKTG